MVEVTTTETHSFYWGCTPSWYVTNPNRTRRFKSGIDCVVFYDDLVKYSFNESEILRTNVVLLSESSPNHSELVETCE